MQIRRGSRVEYMGRAYKVVKLYTLNKGKQLCDLASTHYANLELKAVPVVEVKLYSSNRSKFNQYPAP